MKEKFSWYLESRIFCKPGSGIRQKSDGSCSKRCLYGVSGRDSRCFRGNHGLDYRNIRGFDSSPEIIRH